MNLDAIQSALREAKLDGWLFFDHQERDPLAYRVLGLKGGHVSRRWYYWVPASGANELPLPWGEGRGGGRNGTHPPSLSKSDWRSESLRRIPALLAPENTVTKTHERRR